MSELSGDSGELAAITAAQLRLRVPHPPRTFTDFRRVARWWELEARRGYPSAAHSRWYGANMRLAAERRREGLIAPWTPGVDVFAEGRPKEVAP